MRSGEKWKGSKARELGNGCKLYLLDMKRNGIGIILKPELTKGVIEVRRVFDRILEMKLEIGKEVVNVVSAYAPQAGCAKEEKEEFWKTMGETVNYIPKCEICWYGFKWKTGKVIQGTTRWGSMDWEQEMMEKWQYRVQQGVGWHFLTSISGRKEMAFPNTYFRKKRDHQAPYESGGNKSQVDNLREVINCKVLHGESVVK